MYVTPCINYTQSEQLISYGFRRTCKHCLWYQGRALGHTVPHFLDELPSMKIFVSNLKISSITETSMVYSGNLFLALCVS